MLSKGTTPVALEVRAMGVMRADTRAARPHTPARAQRPRHTPLTRLSFSFHFRLRMIHDTESHPSFAEC